MYTRQDFPTKKSLKEAISQGNEVTVYSPGLGLERPVTDSKGRLVVTLEGPKYPKPHTWCAQCEVDENWTILKVLK
jgi:hypothetical protein